jgi:hypothetical protein
VAPKERARADAQSGILSLARVQEHWSDPFEAPITVMGIDYTLKVWTAEAWQVLRPEDWPPSPRPMSGNAVYSLVPVVKPIRIAGRRDGEPADEPASGSDRPPA